MLKSISPAKINLTLDVYSKRESEDFHPIKTIFHKIALADEMEIHESDHFSIEGDFSCSTKNNLIFEAFTLVQKMYSTNKPVKVIVKKNIPEKAGLGGGSSNFATFVKMYFQYLNFGTIPQELINESAKYGKDIPFFFEKTSCALGENFGEKIKPLNLNFSGQKIFLYQPKFGNDTKSMYQKLKNLNTNFTERFLKNPVLEQCDNSFNACFEAENYQKMLKSFDLKNFTLSGSGSCFFSFEKFDIPECKIFETQLL